MAYYGILGGGTCPENIIEDGLADLNNEGSTFLVVGSKSPSANLERVYDWLLANEATFVVVAGREQDVPRVLREAAISVTIAKDVEMDIIKTVKDNDGRILVMWDEDSPNVTNGIVLDCADSQVTMLELTNGLQPISVTDEAPAKVDKPTTVTTTANADIKVNYTVTQERETLVAPEGDCMVTVVMPNGTVISTPATIEEVRVLLGLSGGS